MIRSVLAVLGGYAVNVIGVSTFFAVVIAVVFKGNLPADPSAFRPPAWLFAAELAVTPIIALAGGYVCAWIARRKELAHGLGLGALMLVLGVVTLFMEHNLKPLWSSLGVIVLGIAGVVAGARFRGARRRAAE
jgi:hypothetical protein